MILLARVSIPVQSGGVDRSILQDSADKYPYLSNLTELIGIFCKILLARVSIPTVQSGRVDRSILQDSADKYPYLSNLTELTGIFCIILLARVSSSSVIENKGTELDSLTKSTS
jgi:hypothetical protein